MSWDIDLKNPQDNYKYPVDRFDEGGIRVVGGCTYTELNVTYNYGCHFDFNTLKGKTALETIPSLEEAVARLGTVQDRNYWEPTEGNTGHACNILLRWAKQFPEGKWFVS